MILHNTDIIFFIFNSQAHNIKMYKYAVKHIYIYYINNQFITSKNFIF